MFVKLKYVDTGTLTIPLGLGAAVYAIWRGNSIYDPYAGVGGHQPYGTDQWAQFYKRYRVYGSRIRFQVIQYNTANANVNYNGFRATVVPYDGTSGFDATLAEMPRARSRWHNSFYAGRPCTVKHYASTAQIYGVSKQTARTNAEFTGTTTSDPASQWYWFCALQKLDDNAVSATNVQVNYQFTITYYVCLYDRKWLDYSVG